MLTFPKMNELTSSGFLSNSTFTSLPPKFYLQIFSLFTTNSFVKHDNPNDPLFLTTLPPRKIIPNIPLYPWFSGLKIPIHQIISYTHLRIIGHSLLPSRSFRLSINSSPLCTLHHKEATCNLKPLFILLPSFTF